MFEISGIEDDFILDVPIKTIKSWYDEAYYMDAGKTSGYRGMTWENYGAIHKAFNDMLLKFNPNPKKILVTGGARGFQAKCFKNKGFTNVITVDISHWATHNPIDPDLKMIEADAAEMPMFEDNEFDYVVLSDLLEHLSPARIDLTLKEINRVANNKIIANIGKDPMYRAHDSDTTHLSIRTSKWWQAKLEKHFDNVRLESVPLPTWFANDVWNCFIMEAIK